MLRQLRLYGCVFAEGRSHVLGYVHENRAGTSGSRDMEGFAKGIRQDAHVFYNIAVLCDGHGHACDVHFLEGVLSQHGQCYVGGNRHHGNGIHVGCGNARHQIGGAGAAGGQADSHLSCGSCVAVSRMCRPLFMRGEHMKNFILMFIQGIIYIEDRSPGIAEYCIHALFLQTFYDDFRSCQLHTFLRSAVVSRHCIYLLRRAAAGSIHISSDCRLWHFFILFQGWLLCWRW